MPRVPRTIYDPSTAGLHKIIEDMQRTLSTGISLGQDNNNNTSSPTSTANIRVWKANGTSPVVANTEFFVLHQLTWVPWTFFAHTDNGGVLYKSGTPWTAATGTAAGKIYLKCTTISAAYQLVIF